MEVSGWHTMRSVISKDEGSRDMDGDDGSNTVVSSEHHTAMKLF